MVALYRQCETADIGNRDQCGFGIDKLFLTHANAHFKG